MSSSWELKSTTLPRCGQLLNEAAEDERGGDVEAGEGLVEKDQLGVVHEGGGDQDLLAHALGVAGDGGMAVVVEREKTKQAVDVFLRLTRRQIAKLSDHGEVFGPGEMGVEVWLLGDIAHAALVGDQIVLYGLAIEEDFAEGHFDEAGDHLHGGGFAGAVGAEVAGDFAGTGGKSDVVHGSDAGEVLGDTAEF